MTEQEYLSKERFPLTNQQTLSLEKQRMLDAINLDDLQAVVKRGDTLTAMQQAFLFELTEKRQQWKEAQAGGP